MNKFKDKVQLLPIIDAILIIIAMILDIISSNMAYPVSNIVLVIVMCIIVILLDMERGLKLLKIIPIRDLCLFVSVICATAAMCIMIVGRLNLMGYVWFSDLESGNPIAVAALNLSAVSWAIFIVSIIIKIVIGLKKDKE